MKKLMLIVLVFLGSFVTVFAQNEANPALDLNLSLPVIGLNSTSTLQVKAANVFGARAIVANSLRVTISVGINAEIVGIDPLSSSNWMVSSKTTGIANTYMLTNIGTVSKNESDMILLTIKGIALGKSINISGNINYITSKNPLLSDLQNASQGDFDISDGSNNPMTSLTVQGRSVAVNIGDVGTAVVDCAARIGWNTLSEELGINFDVEYSPDGDRFVTVGSVAGRSATGSNYTYSYSQNNGKGFYRLKIVSVSGAIAYSKVVNVLSMCSAKKVFIYPNPVQNLQNVHINVTNFVGAVKGDLINATGQIVLTKALVNGSNAVKIANLPEGIYTFKVTDEAKEIQYFKIAVIK